jgi:CTP synthase (UTP-ammonia lyase)
MQLAIVEYCRNVLNWSDAHTAEINPKSSHVVIDIMLEQKKKLLEKNRDIDKVYDLVAIRIIAPGSAYRRDEIDATHLSVFNQLLDSRS